MLREGKNIFLARQFSARPRGAVMAFIPDPIFCVSNKRKEKQSIIDYTTQKSYRFFQLGHKTRPTYARSASCADPGVFVGGGGGGPCQSDKEKL